MASEEGDRFTIRIGGDASGPVVAGHDNRVEVHQTQPDPQPSGPHMTNTANDQATVYTVQNGQIHIHQGPAGPPREDRPGPESTP
ncbi:hypothetical protein ACZ90_39285 [Streptomyces albus subsp. albus]|nr:hypothetical protein ACZ90_39285 [Streptomyces albus subsp. albus]